VQVLSEQLREKQIEFSQRISSLEEELDLERENGHRLEKVTSQRDKYQKIIQQMQEGLD
jgi:chaperonin GroEL (HSP60 family)